MVFGGILIWSDSNLNVLVFTGSIVIKKLLISMTSSILWI